MPPVEDLYQFIVPAEAAALKVAVPESQTAAVEVEVIVGNVFVAITSILGYVWAIPISCIHSKRLL
jgi:hypothetical protein